MLLGLLANQLLNGLLKGGDLLRKEGPLAVDLIPGWQAWGPVSGLEAAPVRTPFGSGSVSSDPVSLKGAKSKAGVATVTLCAGTLKTPHSPGGRGRRGVTEA